MNKSRQRIGAVLIATSCITPSSQIRRPVHQDAAPILSPNTLIAPPIPPHLKLAAQSALHLLSSDEESRLPNIVNVQSFGDSIVPQASTSWLFFTVNNEKLTSQPRPCAIATEPLAICLDHEGPCRDFHPPEETVIVCDYRTIRTMNNLLVSIHKDQSTVETVTRSDRAMLSFITDAEGQSEFAEQNIDEYDTAEHWRLFLTLSLIRAYFHQKLDSKDTVQDQDNNNNEQRVHGLPLDAETRELCENAASLANTMRTMGDPGGSNAPEPFLTPGGYITPTRRWIEEINAERLASIITMQTLEPLRELEHEHRLAPLETRSVYIELLALWGIVSWYRGYAKFIGGPCKEFSSQSYALTRCLCESPSSYKQTGVFFDTDRPPDYLRSAMAIDAALGESLYSIENTSPLILANLMFPVSALTMAEIGCGTGPMARIIGDARIFVEYPALEGISGSDPGTLGSPKPAMDEILDSCCDGLSDCIVMSPGDSGGWGHH